jgi:hypothetical protein
LRRASHRSWRVRYAVDLLNIYIESAVGSSFKHEMWRFQIPGQVIAQYLPSFVECPPMQAGGGLSIGDLKGQGRAGHRRLESAGRLNRPSL